jgi:hypothetical protein
MFGYLGALLGIGNALPSQNPIKPVLVAPGEQTPRSRDSFMVGNIGTRLILLSVRAIAAEIPRITALRGEVGVISPVLSDPSIAWVEGGPSPHCETFLARQICRVNAQGPIVLPSRFPINESYPGKIAR